MQRRSAKRPSGRACALFRSRAKSSRRTTSCSEPAISWCVSARGAAEQRVNRRAGFAGVEEQLGWLAGQVNPTVAVTLMLSTTSFCVSAGRRSGRRQRCGKCSPSIVGAVVQGCVAHGPTAASRADYSSIPSDLDEVVAVALKAAQRPGRVIAQPVSQLVRHSQGWPVPACAMVARSAAAILASKSLRIAAVSSSYRHAIRSQGRTNCGSKCDGMPRRPRGPATR